MHSFNAFNALKDNDASDDDDASDRDARDRDARDSASARDDDARDRDRDDDASASARDDDAMKLPMFHQPFIKKNTFCNNCGKNGHPMHACKNPIISNGMIVFKTGNEGTSSYLMIRRKDTLGFVEFIRGKYPIYNQKHVQRLIDEMTVDEKHRLQTQTFSELWKNVWGDYLNSKYQNEEAVSCDRFNLLKSGIRETPRNGVNYTLSSLIAKSSTQWSEPEWGFPKGRRNYQEKDIDCALREFSEETGYDKMRLVVMQNVVPYEEIFMGSNMKTYKHRYYVAHMPCVVHPPPTFQKTEVSKMAWFSYDQCIQHIRPYNLEKLNILRNLNNARMEHAMVCR